MIAGTAFLWSLVALANHKTAAFDTRCAPMVTSRPQLDPTRDAAQADYFLRPIERRVHQIWFGDATRRDASKTQLWQSMAATFGYEYKLYSEADLEALHALMPARNAALLDTFLASKSYHAASDIVRVSLLEAFGGIYADCDMRPPHVAGELVDPARVIPMQNMVLMTEVDCRNVGARSSLFVANGLMMAAAGHPLVRHWVSTMPDNVEALMARGVADAQGRGPPDFMTGPVFINRSLAGPVTVLPFLYLKQLGIL